MTSRSLPRLSRLSLVVMTGLLVLAGCGSADDSTAPATPAPTVVATESPVAQAADTPTDDRTEQEVAVDKLDLMMIQLGISELEDFEAAESCVTARLESENIEFTGEGTADLIALAGCNDTIISAWLPPTNPALPDETWACTVESIGDWIGELSIPDAEAFFAGDSPPQDFIDRTADRCNATTDDIAAAF